MQSFRQYRQLGDRVRVQLERDRRKVAAIQTSESTGASQNPILSEEQHDTRVDIEKCDASPISTPESFEEAEPADAHDLASTERASRLDEAQYDAVNDGASVLGISLSRISTIRSQRTVGTRLGLTLTGINVRDRTTKEGGDQDRQVFVVDFQGPEDPCNPHNWTRMERIRATVLVACIGAVVGVASSIDSLVVKDAAEEFGVSEVVESMATGLFLVGFGCGALFAGPVSETVGRNPVYIVTLFLYMVFIMASALAPNIGAQLTFRFLAGLWGSTPLTCAGGSLADMWDPMERVYMFPVFANAAFMGPVLGPVISGFVSDSTLVSWRWTEWITLIISALVLILVILFQPETYAPTLLKWKASHLRAQTSDERFVAPIEVRAETLAVRLATSLYRPFVLTFREPIVVLIALYLTVIYIVLFTFLDGYEYIFTEIHGTSTGITGLLFLGIAIGLCFASAIVPLIYSWAKRDLQNLRAAAAAATTDCSSSSTTRTKLPPEFRLWFAMLGGSISIPISLFWMGWTSDSDISIWSPIAASVLFGYGILCVFVSSYQYIIDSYEGYAASALASVTFLRYVWAGGMVVVGIPFYRNVGVHYTLTILGCIAAVLAPLPYVFFRYGRGIRERSRYAVAF